MGRVEYHRYISELWDDLDLEELVGSLSDHLLQSGFEYDGEDFDPGDESALHDAILDAIIQRGLLSDEDLQKLMNDQDALQRFLSKTVERMAGEGYLRQTEGQPFSDPTRGRGGEGRGAPVRFEMTEKTTDFLGYKALRDLLGSLGKSSFGHHETRDLSTGVEASGPTKTYEFGDTLNLDVSGTLLSASRGKAFASPSTWTTRTCSSGRPSTSRLAPPS